MNLFAAMRAFVEIVDRGSLTAAAHALERSQPAMVRTLAQLETRLGARLLNRTTRRMSLTPEGREYLARCRAILADVDEAELAAGRQQVEPRGILRLTAPVLFGQMHVAPALTAFLQRYRDVHAELLLLDRNVDLVAEGIDLAVRIGALADSSMVAMAVRTTRRVICASPDLLASTGVPSHPRELGARPCIRFTGLSEPGDWRFRERQGRITVAVGGSLSCNHLGVAIDACIASLGFGRFLSYQVAPMLACGALETVLEAYEPAPLPVSLVYPAARLVPARQRVLLDWMKAALGPARSDAAGGDRRPE